MSHIFISYSRSDIVLASKIVQALADNNLDTWVDWKSIPKGEDWEQEIYRGVEEADAFLFLISPDSVASQMCNKEIEHAVKNGKRILPIVIRDADPKSIHPEISKRNWIFCRDGQDDFNNAIEETRKTIHTDYEWLKYHTELQIKALKWEQKQDASRLLRGKELREAENRLTEAGITKEPQPTDLQRKYFLESTKEEWLRRNWIIAISSVAGIVMVVLGAYAQFQGDLATNRAATAQVASTGQAQQAKTAQAASTLAIANEATAQAEKQHAEEQAQITRAGELVAQSVSVRDHYFDLSLLLALESHGLLKNNRTHGNLLDSTQANPFLALYIFGHNNEVPSTFFTPESYVSAAFTPEGYIMVVMSDGTRQIWNPKTRKPVNQPTIGDSQWGKVIAISPDGKKLVSLGVNNSTATVWDIVSGIAIAQPFDWKAPDDNINHSVESATFSPDSKTLALASTKDTIELWDIENSRPFGQPLVGHRNWVSSVVFSPDGTMLASGSGDWSAMIWDMNSGKPIHSRLQGHSGIVNSVAFSPDSKYLATGSNDTTIILWSVETGQQIGQPFIGHQRSVDAIAFSPDGSVLASGSADASIILWDVATGKPIQPVLTGHSIGVDFLSFSTEGRFLLSKSLDQTIILWDLNRPQPLKGHTNSVESVAFSPDGKILASGSRDGSVFLWDLETRQPIDQLISDEIKSVESIAFSPDGKVLAVGGCTEIVNQTQCLRGGISLWEIDNRQLLGYLLDKPRYSTLSAGNSVKSLAFSPDGTILASGSDDWSLVLWDMATSKVSQNSYLLESFIMNNIRSSINDISFSLDGTILAIAGGRYTVLWNIAKQESIGTPLSDINNYIDSIAISPDSNILVEGRDRSIVLWNIITGDQIGELLEERSESVSDVDFSPTSSVVFNPDGSILASGNWGGEVILWDVVEQKQIGKPLLGHTGAITEIAFSPDNTLLASSSTDATIIIWNTDAQFLTSQTCERVGRNLSQTEWTQYFPGEEYRITCTQWPAGQ